MTTTSTVITTDTTITGPYVLARITLTNAPEGESSVCWGVYNIKTKQALRNPGPGPLVVAIDNLLARPDMHRYYSALHRDNAPEDLALTVPVMDVTATGASPSTIKAFEDRGLLGTLRFSYNDLHRAEKARNIHFDVTRLVERCEGSIDITTQVAEEEGIVIPDIAPYLDVSLYTLKVAQEKAQAYVDAVALENLITLTNG